MDARLVGQWAYQTKTSTEMDPHSFNAISAGSGTSCAAQQLELKELRVLFEAIDANGDGQISRTEFITALRLDTALTSKLVDAKWILMPELAAYSSSRVSVCCWCQCSHM